MALHDAHDHDDVEDQDQEADDGAEASDAPAALPLKEHVGRPEGV